MVLLAVIVLFTISCIAIPKVRYQKQKEVFKSYKAGNTIEKTYSRYSAFATRYDLTLEEWQEFQKKMDGFQLIPSDWGSKIYPGTGASYIESFFTAEEIDSLSEGYYKEEYVGIRFFNRCRIESYIGVIINDDSVSVYYSSNLIGRNIK